MSEPALLFSPLPEPAPTRDAMVGERDADSVLFSLDGAAAAPAPDAPASLGDRESSGLVDIRDLFTRAQSENGEPPKAETAPPASRDSSGLVDLAKIIAESEPDTRPATLPPLSLVPNPAPPAAHVAPPAPRAAIPTPVLLTVIVALLGALAALAWKVGAS